MKKAPLPDNEKGRLEALQAVRAAAARAGDRLDRITRVAAHGCGAPAAAISFMGASLQCVRSQVGFDLREIPRELTPCAWTIAQGELLTISGLDRDERFKSSPLVMSRPSFRFYAGVPLVTSTGFPIGTLSVFDHTPRQLSSDQQLTLVTLAEQVMTLLESERSALLDSNMPQYFHETVDALSDAIFAIDREGHFKYVNQEAERWLKKGRDELLGKNIWLELPSLANSNFHRQCVKASEEGSKTEFEDFFPLQNGWFQIHLYPSKRGTAVFLSDITDRKYAEEALRRSEARFSGIFRSSLVGIVFADANGNIEDANEAFLKTVGYSRDDLGRGQVRWETLNPEDQIANNQIVGQMLRKHGYCPPFEKEYLRKDGSRVPVLVGVALLKDSRNTAVTFVLDISDKKRADQVISEQQAKIIASSKMSTLGEMAAGIAHEINNPLTIVYGHLRKIQEKIAQQGELDPGVRKSFEVAEATLGRISKIVKGLRSFAREGEQDPFLPAKVGSLLEDTLELCRERMHNHGVKLRVNIHDPTAEIECRASQVEQVLLNLMNNAHDAILQFQDKWIQVDVEDCGEMIQFSVTDCGTGVPSSVREKIFNPFFTTKEVGKGTGIGLSISKGIIDAHRGTLTLDDSSPNTRFIVRLPKQQQLQEKKAA